MRRFAAIMTIPMTFALAACAGAGDDVTAPGGSAPAGSPAFDDRAAEVAEAWLAAVRTQAWRSGYVPLEHPTVLVGEPVFGPDTKQAFAAGWYRDQVKLPTADPGDGAIRFPDGSLNVPLLSAVEAYRQIDQGDPPPCARRPATPPATARPAAPPGPDTPAGVDSGPAGTACIPLTVTAVELGTVELRTSRGAADVPAWLFTIEELGGQVARVAVDPSAVGNPPEAASPGQPVAGLVAAQDLTAVDGTRLDYRLGVGACDVDITPLVREQEEVVVVAGTVSRSPGICTEQLVLTPVSVTLDRPLGSRPVVDAVTGQALVLVPAP